MQQYEDTKKECLRLYDKLHTHQMNSILEGKNEHKKHMKELEEARTEFGQQIDRVTAETTAKVRSLNTSCKLLMTKLRLGIDQAKPETLALQAMYDKREEHINV